jgi:deazaflavin-dependent oxidoreductase (nitroreductase family)
MNSHLPTSSLESQFLYLTTKGWKTGKLHKIEIWFVKENKKYYVLSEHGMKSHWVQNILHDPRISFQVDGQIFNGYGRIIKDAVEKDLINRVSELMDKKYGWSDGLIMELSTPS